MAMRLEENARVITWTNKKSIVVGYHDCDVCGTETPAPTMEEMVEFAKSGCEHSMWPGEYWGPPGWETSPLLCPECIAVREAAFDERRKLNRRPMEPIQCRVCRVEKGTQPRGGYSTNWLFDEDQNRLYCPACRTDQFRDPGYWMRE